MISQEDRNIIEGFRDNVFLLKAVRDQIEWNQRHRLPVLELPAQAAQLMHDVAMFELAMDRIRDRRTRNIIRCRFGLGWPVWDIALAMEMHRNTVNRIIREQLQKMTP